MDYFMFVSFNYVWKKKICLEKKLCLEKFFVWKNMNVCKKSACLEKVFMFAKKPNLYILLNMNKIYQ